MGRGARVGMFFFLAASRGELGLFPARPKFDAFSLRKTVMFLLVRTSGLRRGGGRTGTPRAVRCALQGAHTKFFYVKSAQSQCRCKAPYKASLLPECITRKPRRNEVVRRPRQNPWWFIVVRPTKPLGVAFTSRVVRNHGAGLLEDSPTRASAGPQVRPPAPCFTVAPVPGPPGHATRHSANVPWRPRFSQLFPHRWRPREPACPLSASVGNSWDSPPAKPPPDIHPRPHLTSESCWSSLQDWAARTRVR